MCTLGQVLRLSSACLYEVVGGAWAFSGPQLRKEIPINKTSLRGRGGSLPLGWAASGCAHRVLRAEAQAIT